MNKTLTARQETYLADLRQQGEAIVAMHDPWIVRRTFAALERKGLVAAEVRGTWTRFIPAAR